MTERSSGGASVSKVTLVAAGGALLVVGFVWGRHVARRRMTEVPPRRATHAARPPGPPEPPAPPAADDAGASWIMRSELERLAAVAASHGSDDPALDVFLAFVAALDPVPDAATLKPAAQRIGELRLSQALGRPGEPSLGARRLLAAAADELPDTPAARATGTVTVEHPAETGRLLPELFESLLHAIRVALSLVAWSP